MQPAKTSTNHPKAPTTSQKHPQLAKTFQQPKLLKTNKRHLLSKLTPNKKPQESSLLEYVGETLTFLEFFRQILECLVIWVTKDIEFERVGIYPFRIPSGHILHC